VTGVEQGQNIAFLNEVSHHLLSAAAAASTNQTPTSCVKSIIHTNGTERAKETLILPILMWMRTCERAADVIYFSLYKHPAAEDKFHSSSFLLS
jgi:hypothetical protein